MGENSEILAELRNINKRLDDLDKKHDEDKRDVWNVIDSLRNTVFGSDNPVGSHSVRIALLEGAEKARVEAEKRRVSREVGIMLLLLTLILETFIVMWIN